MLLEDKVYGSVLVWSPIIKEAYSIIDFGINYSKEEIMDFLRENGNVKDNELFFSLQKLNDGIPQTYWLSVDIDNSIMNILSLAHKAEIQSNTQNIELEDLFEKHNIKHL
jgi:asparagine synthetase A